MSGKDNQKPGCSHWKKPKKGARKEKEADEGVPETPVRQIVAPPFHFENGMCIVRWYDVPEYAEGEHYFDHKPPPYWRQGTPKWWHDHCKNCGRKGHHSKICDQPQNEPRCIYCGYSGHTIHACPLRLAMRQRRRDEAAKIAREAEEEARKQTKEEAPTSDESDSSTSDEQDSVTSNDSSGTIKGEKWAPDWDLRSEFTFDGDRILGELEQVDTSTVNMEVEASNNEPQQPELEAANAQPQEGAEGPLNLGMREIRMHILQHQLETCLAELADLRKQVNRGNR